MRSPRVLAAGLLLATAGCGAAADPPEPPPAEGARDGGEVPAVAGGPEYPVGDAAPRRAGQRFAFARKRVIEKTTEERSAGAVVSQSTRNESSAFSGVVRIAEVDEAGQPVSLIYDVAELTKRDGPSTWALERGTRITIVRAEDEDQALFTVGGRPATEAERGELSSLVALGRSDTSDETLFRTSEPRRVGESWRGREDILRRELEDEGLVVPEGGLSVTARLVRVIATPEGDEREIACEVRLDGFSLPGPGDGWKTTRSSLRTTLTFLLSPDGWPREQRSRRTLDVEVAVDAARSLRIVETTSDESRTEPL